MIRLLYCLLLLSSNYLEYIRSLQPIAQPCSKIEIDKRIQELLPAIGFTRNDKGKHGAFFHYICEPDYTRTDEDGIGHFECLSMFTGRCKPISLETRNPFLPMSGSAVTGKVPCSTGAPGMTASATTSYLRCGDVPAIEHGVVSDGQSCFGSKRSIECDSDFRLVGSETIECGIDTKWIVRGHCEEKICCDEPMVQNGFISSGSNYIGAKRQLGCHDDFVLLGSSLVTCNSDAKWLIGGYCEQAVPPIDCEDIHLRIPSLPSGVYPIYPPNGSPVFVYCEMDYLGGGWTVFQSRVDDSQDFFLNWTDYKKGFGNLTANFWLGNENIHAITSGPSEYNLLIALTANDGSTGYALYDGFRIDDEANGYILRFRNFIANEKIGDSLSYNKDHPFSTFDRDSSTNYCVKHWHAPWWHFACTFSSLNGVYGDSNWQKGLVWYSWQSSWNGSIQKVSMMTRRSSL